MIIADKLLHEHGIYNLRLRGNTSQNTCMKRDHDRKSESERESESVKNSGTIHTLGDTKDQSLSPVTLKQTFLCDVKPWSSLEPMPFGIVAFSNAS